MIDVLLCLIMVFMVAALLLRRIYADRAESVIFIGSGPERAYREVISAMDIAKGAGVQVLTFAP